MEKVDYLMKVQNDTAGKLLIQLVKENLAPNVKLVLRGSKPDQQRIKRDKFRMSPGTIPLKYAQEIRVYFQDKKDRRNLGVASHRMEERIRKEGWEARRKVFELEHKMARIASIAG